MKTSTPKKINRRDNVVDTMAKKFANSGSVTHIITTHRKRRFKPAVYLQILIGLSVISTAFTTLVMTGKIQPVGIGPSARNATATPIVNTIDLLREDLAKKEIGIDDYALYMKDYLVHYSALPDKYKTKRSTTGSGELFRELYTVWPQVSLRTRSVILQAMPFLEARWEAMHLERAE
jgi:hypothetical protein